MSTGEPPRLVPSDEPRPPSDLATASQSHHNDWDSDTPRQDQPSGHGGHGLMMIICCIPMLVIAGILLATGAAGVGVVVLALLCTAMMAAMMLGMGGHKH